MEIEDLQTSGYQWLPVLVQALATDRHVNQITTGTGSTLRERPAAGELLFDPIFDSLLHCLMQDHQLDCRSPPGP